MTLPKAIKNAGMKEAKLVLLVIIALGVGFLVSPTAAFFWTIFIGFILFNIDSTIIAQAALVCLVMLPILLATGKESVAEQVAVYAYFLLAMTVALQIIELKRSSGHEEDAEFESPRPLLPLITPTVMKKTKKISDILPVRNIKRKNIAKQIQSKMADIKRIEI